MLQIALLLTTIGLLVTKSMRRRPWLNPVKMFLYGWLVVEVAYTSHLITYRLPLQLGPVLLLIAAKCAFVAGALLVDRSGGRRIPAQEVLMRTDGFDRLMLLIVVALAALAGMYAIRDLLSLGVFGANFFSGGGLSEVRGQLWEQVYSGEVDVSPIRSLLSTSAFSIAVLLPYFIKSRKRALAVAAAVCCLIVVAESILVAGRFMIGLLVMMLAIGFATAANRSRLSELINVRWALIGFGIMFYFFIAFPVQRNPNLPSAIETYLGLLSDATISPWVMAASDTPGLGWLPIFAYSTSYFSAALDMYNYFISSTHISSWYQAGFYNLPILSQIAAGFDIGGNRWLEIRRDIATLMDSVGLSPNPWATGVRDLVIDFGRAGSVIIIGWIGALFQLMYVKGVASRRFYWKVLLAHASAGSFLFSFISPLLVRPVSNGIIFIGTLLLLRTLLASVRNRKADPVPA